MELGSLRCDANISVRKVGEPFGTRVEVKNLNSFKAVAKAIDYEIGRQIEHIEKGGTVDQETRLWDDSVQVTRIMRSKEEANDYRYFPDPDLLPVIITDEMMEKYSPVFHVDQIKAPLFIAQGANDPRVNKAESDQMVEALKKRGIEVEYMVKDNEGHGFHNEENKFDFYRAMEKFLDAHLKK